MSQTLKVSELRQGELFKFTEDTGVVFVVHKAMLISLHGHSAHILMWQPESLRFDHTKRTFISLDTVVEIIHI